MFLASFTNGALQNAPATADEASVDACIEQRFGQRRQSWLKTNQRQSAQSASKKLRVFESSWQ